MKLTRAPTIVAIAGAVSACHPTSSRQAKAATTPATPEVVSAVHRVRIVRTSRLPPNPNRIAVGDDCSAYAVAKPKTPGGQLAARNGWIVTSESKLGGYDTVTFVGGLDPSTSATCAHLVGNLAVFAGRDLKALAYLRPDSSVVQGEPSPGADTAAEDSLGSAEQIDPRRIRLSYGLPSAPFADVVLGEGISVEKIADKDSVCSGAAFVPNIFGQDILKARKKLMANGWLPEKPAEKPSADTLPRGVVETEDCSGTGYGFCAFNYRHQEGISLRVISMGEEYSVTSYSAYCGGSRKGRTGQ